VEGFGGGKFWQEDGFTLTGVSAAVKKEMTFSSKPKARIHHRTQRVAEYFVATEIANGTGYGFVAHAVRHPPIARSILRRSRRIRRAHSETPTYCAINIEAFPEDSSRTQ
jgi:hypothetical protein